MSLSKKYIFLFITFWIASIAALAQNNTGMISGKVLSLDGDPIDYATVFLKGTSYSCSTNEKLIWLHICELKSCRCTYDIIIQ